MTKFISIFNHQKKSGKTTTAIFLSECLATLGFKVLLLDGNYQNQIDKKIAKNIAKSKLDKSGLIEYFKIKMFERSWHFLPYYDIEKLKESNFQSLFIDYEYVLFDTPSLQTDKAAQYLSFSNSAIIPIEDEFFGTQELNSTLKTVYLNQNKNQDFYINGFLFNRTVDMNIFADQFKEQLNKDFKGVVYKTNIYRNFYLSQSAFEKVEQGTKSITSLGYTDYLCFANEFLERENKLILKDE